MGNPSRPLGALSGVRAGTPTSTVSATSTTWACAPHAGILDVQVAAEAGAYSYSVDAAVSGTLTPADATYPRTDIVYVQVSDPAEDGSAAPAVAVGYLAGSPSQTPQPKAAPARSLVLAQINVPKAGGGAPSITWTAPQVGTGAPRFQTKAQLDAWTTATRGQEAVVVADPTVAYSRPWYFDGTGWVHSLTPGVPFAVASGSGNNVASSYAIVNFPAGRFTVAPRVYGKTNGAVPAMFHTSSISTTTAMCAGFTGTSATASSWDWFAVQMSPAAA